MMARRAIWWCWIGLVLAGPAQLAAEPASVGGRLTIALDGEWQIGESVAAEFAPVEFPARGPVPGLVRLARPGFPDVDDYEPARPRAERATEGYAPDPLAAQGTTRQSRKYFWYMRDFEAPAARELARLRIGKAQFGVAVWLNGTLLGESLDCFASATFDATAAIRWGVRNRLLVRVGAHPGVLPATVPAGTDPEKTKWTPGIYDSVELRCSDGSAIESVQVAPRIADGSILVQTRLRNRGPGRTVRLRQTVTPWRVSAEVVRHEETLELGADEERTITVRLTIPGARLWSPEDPFLYQLDTGTGGDSERVRFGMREFRFDTPTRRAYLNGRMRWLRGSSITLHRFFEDPACGALPWDEAWVRRLLVTLPREMNWNSFRFCIGPVPQRWMEIADEAGLLIHYEYPIFGYRAGWEPAQIRRQMERWMADNWNHPSLILWDACNETRHEVLAREVVPLLRQLDLSGRAWENGYNPPDGPDDPIENHPYEGFHRTPPVQLAEFETKAGEPGKLDDEHFPPSGHALLMNEYGSFWIRRDGGLTRDGKEVLDRFLPPNAPVERRFETVAYLLAGLTEYWRAHRNFAGVYHFVYLTASVPGLVTADNFRDVARLELDPYFKAWVGDAFKPLGVYLRFWQPAITAGRSRRICVMLHNDEPEAYAGELRVRFEPRAGGPAVAESRELITVAPFGQRTVFVSMSAPRAPGEYRLVAEARTATGATTSRRWVTVSAAP